MAKVVVSAVGGGPKRRAKTHGPKTKRVRDASGKIVTVRVLDVGSRSFGDELQAAFRSSVTRARRDNKRLTGAPDVVPSEG